MRSIFLRSSLMQGKIAVSISLLMISVLDFLFYLHQIVTRFFQSFLHFFYENCRRIVAGETEIITESPEKVKRDRPLHTTPTRAAERGYFTASPRQDRMTYFNRLLLSRGASTAVLISNRKSLVDRPANPHPSRSGRARFASVA